MGSPAKTGKDYTIIRKGPRKVWIVGAWEIQEWWIEEPGALCSRQVSFFGHDVRDAGLSLPVQAAVEAMKILTESEQ